MEVVIGGRIFTPINMDRRTVRLDHYLQRMLSESGIDRLETLPSESPEIFQARALERMVHSGKACKVLGAYLLPLGMTERDWTLDIAVETETYLSACDTEEDRIQVLACATECVLSFFLRRLRSALAVLNSSARAPVAGRPHTTAH